jgi:hypothetical protein
MIRLASLISRIERHKDKAKELMAQNISDYLSSEVGHTICLAT